MLRRSFLVPLLVVAFSSESVWAQTPIAYQGRLEDAATGPLSNFYDFQFSIYDDPAGGNLVWTETQTNVQVSGGAFTVKLGVVSAIDDSIWGDSAAYPNGLHLQIAVRLTSAGGAFTVLNNRQEILYVPRAVQANSIKACIVVTESGSAGASSNFGPLAASCGARKLTGGGFSAPQGQAINITSSYPNMGSNQWVVYGNNSGGAATVSVYAVCCP